MNDDILLISGGGSTAVSTDDLFAERAALDVLCHQAAQWGVELRRIRSMASGAAAVPAPAWTSTGPDYALFAAAQALDHVAATSGELAGALSAAAESYGEAERSVERLTRLTGSGIAALLGFLTPALALLAIPMLTSAVTGWFLASVLNGTSMKGLATAIGRTPRLLTNPAVVALVRVLVSSVDDAVAGVLRVPPPLIPLLGDDGLGVMGVATSAASVLFTARQFEVMNETPVTATPVGRGRPVAAPEGVRGLAERIPRAKAGDPQVRIERYGAVDAPSWIVYVGGTIDWHPEPTIEPWDLTSNIAAVAEEQAGSYRAVLDAMAQAGIGPTDPVTQVGHSQGGLIAAQVAASEKFNTTAVLTFGAPAGQVPVPAVIPMLAVAYTDDIVPALGGTANDATADGNAHLLVRREIYGDAAVPADVPLPAHRMTTYTETAALIDESNDPRIVAFTAGVAAAIAVVPSGAPTPASAVGSVPPGSVPPGSVPPGSSASADSLASAVGTVTFWRGIRVPADK